MRIAAVVVTYNRLNLLKECIDAIRNQTRKVDEIIVINNSSTDGTLAWLEEQNDLTVITQENLGGAGGFYTGIKTAYEKGYDWIWCMDDDAEPQKDALENISLFSKNYSVNTVNQEIELRLSQVTPDRLHSYFLSGSISALACLEVDQNMNILHPHRGYFNFGNVFSGIVKKFAESDIKKEFVEIDHASFVGIIVNSRAIHKAGYPNREFFIHYDDVEYCIRLRSVGKILLIPSSVIVHKEAAKGGIKKRFLGRQTQRVDFHKFWLWYYDIRNLVWLGKQHSENKVLFYFQMIRAMVKNILGIILFDDNKYRRLRFVLSAYADGLKGKFDNEKPKRILYQK